MNYTDYPSYRGAGHDDNSELADLTSLVEKVNAKDAEAVKTSVILAAREAATETRYNFLCPAENFLIRLHSAMKSE
jgi:hypothetical protein